MSIARSLIAKMVKLWYYVDNNMKQLENGNLVDLVL